jgi:hypothetical protein
MDDEMAGSKRYALVMRREEIMEDTMSIRDVGSFNGNAALDTGLKSEKSVVTVEKREGNKEDEDVSEFIPKDEKDVNL